MFLINKNVKKHFVAFNPVNNPLPALIWNICFITTKAHIRLKPTENSNYYGFVSCFFYVSLFKNTWGQETDTCWSGFWRGSARARKKKRKSDKRHKHTWSRRSEGSTERTQIYFSTDKLSGAGKFWQTVPRIWMFLIFWCVCIAFKLYTCVRLCVCAALRWGPLKPCLSRFLKTSKVEKQPGYIRNYSHKMMMFVPNINQQCLRQINTAT